MQHYGSDTRLTDELERQLVREAILDDMAFKPMTTLKSLLGKLGQALHLVKSDTHHVPTAARTAG